MNINIKKIDKLTLATPDLATLAGTFCTGFLVFKY